MPRRFSSCLLSLFVLPLLLYVTCRVPAGAAPSTSDVHKQFAEKDATIAKLRRQIEALTAQVTELKAQAAISEVNAPNSNGMTPLTLAVQSRNLKKTELLLDKGATVDVKNQHSANDNSGGVTALMWAARYGHVPVINLLVDHGASLTLGDNGGRGGALFWSGSYGQAAATKALLDRGAPVSAKDKDGKRRCTGPSVRIRAFPMAHGMRLLQFSRMQAGQNNHRVISRAWLPQTPAPPRAGRGSFSAAGRWDG